MRGQVDRQQSMFVAFDLEQRVPEDHPLRPIKRFCDRVLAKMSRDFARAYGTTGNVSIPPECLLKALLLRALYSIPSETKLCEACEYNLLYRWFIDWPLEKKMWTPEAFSMNRDRFELHDLAGKFFHHVVAEGLADRLTAHRSQRGASRTVRRDDAREGVPLLHMGEEAARPHGTSRYPKLRSSAALPFL